MTKNERSLIAAAKKVIAKGERLGELVSKNPTASGEKAVAAFRTASYDFQAVQAKVEAV